MSCNPGRLQVMLPDGLAISPFAVLLGTVRDPLDRILSEHTHKVKFNAPQPGFSEWVRSSGAVTAVNNAHVRRFCGPSCFSLPPEALNETHLQKALDNLALFTVVIPVANFGVRLHYCSDLHVISTDDGRMAEICDSF